MGHNYVGTEHVLLALLEQEDGDGVLTRSGVDGERVEQAVTEAIAAMTGGGAATEAGAGAGES
jgi:ATP-dependent Clp protease ATP-binding subunit ClpA